MNKILLLSAFIALAFSKIIAQETTCGSAEIHNQMMLTDTAYATKMLNYENFLVAQSVIDDGSSNMTTGIVYQIPVVVHVMHKGEPVGFGVNVSDAAIQNAIRKLNESYRKIPGTAGFGNGVDVEIEYVLAVRDPLGNCTNGIDRVNMTGNALYMSNGVNRASIGGITDAALKAIAVWNQNNYYNIWLISEIDNNNGAYGIQGYAYFASSHGTSVDGAVILSSNFTSGTATTAAHEIGHSLNLYHTFEGDGTGGTCPVVNGCGAGAGDCCVDIPAHRRSSSNCVTGINICDGITQRDLFIHNYMDYSSDLCQNELTANQKTRMISALTTIRMSFLASNGNMGLVPVTTAGVDFTALGTVLCGVGQSVRFLDNSTCVPNSYTPLSAFSGVFHTWTITDGVNTYTSSLQNPVITFTTTGTYDVTLSITNGFGTTSLTKLAMIVVASTPALPCTPTSGNSGNFGQTINNVKLNTINASSSTFNNIAFTDLTCTYNTVVTAGSTYNLSISAGAIGGSGAEVFEVYINYNNNALFTDPGELVFSGSAPNNTAGTFTTNIIIPLTATQNTLLRMRVMGDAAAITAGKRTCGSAFFIGDVKDFGVYIKPLSCTAPTITATTPSARCGTGTLTLGATTNTGTINWYANPVGGVSIGTGTIFTTPSLTATTIYYVDAISVGCTSPVRTAVTASINAIPVLTLTASGSTICAGQTVTLTANGAASYTWTPLSTGSTKIVSPIASTGYTVIGTFGNCNSVSKTTTVSVVSVPVITLTPLSSTICAGNSTTLTVSGAASYTWSPSGSGASSVLSPTTTTIYTVYGSVGSCTSATQAATINVSAIPVVTLTASSSTICSGQTVTLTASGASTYTWAPLSTGSTKIVTPIANTGYTVTGTLGSCNSIAKTTTVNVVSVPVITLTPLSSTICAGNSATLTVSGAASYTWSPSGSGASSVLSPTITTIYSVYGSIGSCTSATQAATINVSATPIVTITASSSTICAGQTVTLTASGAASYTWTPLSTGSTKIVTPLANTGYTVIGTVGSCNSIAKTTTVSVVSVPVITLTPLSSTICAGNSRTLTVSGASSYTWSPSGSGASSVLSPTTTTIYTVYGSIGTCTSTIKSATINVSATPIITLTPSSSTICKGSSITLNVSGASSYTWSPAGSGSSSILSPTNTTIYSIIGSAGICISTPQTATVNVTPIPTVTLIASSFTICSGQSSTLSALGASSYTWSPLGSGSSSILSPTITTTYTVIGDVSSCIGLPQMATINVLSIPVMTLSPLSSTICSGKTVTISVAGGISYTWTPAGSGSSSALSPIATTNYTVIGSDGICNSKESNFNIIMTPNPILNVTASATLICLDESSTLSVSGATSYSWSPAGTLSSSVGSSVVASPIVSTSYTVIGLNGLCTTTSSIDLIVNACTGINEMNSMNGILIFPNPSHGLINIQFNSEILDSSISIINAIGQEVYFQDNIKTQNLILNISNLSEGLYYLKSNTSKGFSVSKIIKN